MCTFSDKEMAEYIRHKKTTFHSNNPSGIKKAVSIIGKQLCSNVYMLGPNAIFDNSGNLIDVDECGVVGVSDIVSGQGVASCSSVCDIVTPPTVALSELFELIPKVFKHNAVPELHNLMMHSTTFPTRLMHVHAVINHPHIADWFFHC